MLVLQRYKGQQIIIGSDVILTVVGIQGDKVKIGIDAPLETRVDRMEIHERIEREQRERELLHHDGRAIDTRASIVMGDPK